MASFRRRKALTCFYCNNKSKITYDGVMKQWACLTCDADNYLDSNGDITDPPVATFQESPPTFDYAVNRPTSSSTSSQNSFSAPPSQPAGTFCATCIKNQHLLTSSLAQYHVEIEPSHPNYRESEKQYYKYRKSLETLYPQCCVDCEPMAYAHMQESTKTAKADYARRLLSKSRARRIADRTRNFSLGDVLDFTGKFLWWMSIILQLLWNASIIAQIAEKQYSTNLDSHYLPSDAVTWWSIISTLSFHLPAAQTLAYYGLWCAGFSLWWSPKFKDMHRGFMNQVAGYGEWYKNQFFLLGIRTLFYFAMARDHLARDFSEATQAGHGFIFVFTLALAIRSTYYIKVDMNKLWTPPQKLSVVGPSSKKPVNHTMEDLLGDMGVKSYNQVRTPSPPFTQPKRFVPQPYVPGSIRIVNGKPPAPTPNLRALDLTVFSRRNSHSPPFFSNDTRNAATSASGTGPLPDQPKPDFARGDSMDWSPDPDLSRPKSQHRAFTENLPVDAHSKFFGRVVPKQSTKLFSQSPVTTEADRGAFWYKVPPAPITPARQKRNPPNQPSMRAVSEEQKQNFFNSGKKGSSFTPSSQKQKQNIEFHEQRFFAPSTSEVPDEFLSSFGSWSIGDTPKVSEKSAWRRIWQGATLAAAIVGGYQAWLVYGQGI